MVPVAVGPPLGLCEAVLTMVVQAHGGLVQWLFVVLRQAKVRMDAMVTFCGGDVSSD